MAQSDLSLHERPVHEESVAKLTNLGASAHAAGRDGRARHHAARIPDIVSCVGEAAAKQPRISAAPPSVLPSIGASDRKAALSIRLTPSFSRMAGADFEALSEEVGLRSARRFRSKPRRPPGDLSPSGDGGRTSA